MVTWNKIIELLLSFVFKAKYSSVLAGEMLIFLFYSVCAYIYVVNWNLAKTYISKSIIEQVSPNTYTYIALRMYDTRTSQPITPYFMLKNENVSHSEIRYVWVIWETYKGLCHQFWLFFTYVCKWMCFEHELYWRGDNCKERYKKKDNFLG